MTDHSLDGSDEASLESFPASDPPAWTPIAGVHVVAAGEARVAETVVHNGAERRFEVVHPDGMGVLTYRMHGEDTIELVHTEVDPALRGRGVAARLAHDSLEYARENHLRVVPTCSYVRAYLQRHPEYADVLAA